MSEGNGAGKSAELLFCAAAVIGVIVLTGGLSYSYGKHSGAGQHAEEHREAAKKKVTRACAGIDPTHLAECVVHQVEAEAKGSRDEQELDAQRRSADAAVFSAYLSFGALIATLAGLIFIRNTLLETRATTRISREAQDLAERQALDRTRPYIFADFRDGDVYDWRMARGWVDGVRFCIANHGEGPAVIISVECHFSIEFEQALIPEQIASFVQFARSAVTPPGVLDDASNLVLAAGETADLASRAHVYPLEAYRAPRPNHPTFETIARFAHLEDLFPVFNGVIRYRDVHRREFVTRFAWRLRGPENVCSEYGGEERNFMS